MKCIVELDNFYIFLKKNIIFIWVENNPKLERR